MTIPATRNFALLLPFLFITILSGCDSGRSTKIEILSGPAPGKKIIRVASSDEAYVHFMKMAENYSLQRNVQFEISQTQGKNIPGLIEKKTVDIGVTARRLDPKPIGTGLSYIPYAYDGLVFLAAPDAKIRSL
ncbi:MAG: PBP domain protein, partial [Actinobacteria bacterium]|nr:PBP domain protein [Actinomycetota bacterium]